MSKTKLSANLNKVATLRNTRVVGLPSVEHAARICLDAGVHGITLHPRPDQRHIRPTDVDAIAKLVATRPGIELNLEGNPFRGLVAFADAHRPAQCTLVPDEDGQSTSDHGWDLGRDGERLRPVIAHLRRLGCRVSLFMDPVPDALAAARTVGADRVELYTESYASAFARDLAANLATGAATHPGAASLATFRESALAARRAGLGVNAGHDLNLQNLGPFLAAVPDVLEVSIGHALVSDALEFGLAETVRRYLALCA